MSILKNIQPCFIFTMCQNILPGNSTEQEPISADSNNDHAPQGDHEGCDDCNDNEGEQRGKLN